MKSRRESRKTSKMENGGVCVDNWPARILCIFVEMVVVVYGICGIFGLGCVFWWFYIDVLINW